MTQFDPSAVPEEFPRVNVPPVVAGVQPKIGVALCNGKYYAGQAPEERFERWDICEDLARQLAPVAQADAAKHPEHSIEQTLKRVRISVARRDWVSHAEMDWLLQRIRTLLAW